MAKEIVSHGEVGYATTNDSSTDTLADLVFGKYFLQFAYLAEAKRQYGVQREKAAYIANVRKNGN